MSVKVIAAPGYGFSPDTKDGRIKNASGGPRVKGEVLMLDLGDTTTSTDTDTAEGDTSSGYANGILPATVGIGSLSGAANPRPGYIFGVILDDTVADGAVCNVRWKGFCDVSVTADAATIGVGMFPANGVATLTATIAAGVKCLAILRQANGSAVGVLPCYFNGIEGWGHMAVS